MPSMATEQDKGTKMDLPHQRKSGPPAGVPIMGGPSVEPKYAYLDQGIYFIPLWSGKLHRRGMERRSGYKQVSAEEYYPDIIMVAVSDGVQNGKGLREALTKGAKPLSECPREGINCTELDKHQDALDRLMRQQIDAHHRKLQLVRDGILESRRVKLAPSQEDLFNWWLGQSKAGDAA